MAGRWEVSQAKVQTSGHAGGAWRQGWRPQTHPAVHVEGTPLARAKTLVVARARRFHAQGKTRVSREGDLTVLSP